MKTTVMISLALVALAAGLVAVYVSLNAPDDGFSVNDMIFFGGLAVALASVVYGVRAYVAHRRDES